jgi:hypothetical protein
MTRIGLIVDADEKLQAWQLDALLGISGIETKLAYIFVCQDKVVSKRSKQNLLYFVVIFIARMFAVEFKKKSIPSSLLVKARVLRFNCERSGSWQRMPSEIHETLKSCDVVVKFGMNLLKIEKSWEPSFGVISYHHGNPAKYRGRPPAFYELLYGEDSIAVIVQKLTNILDAGDILAIAESRVFTYSYRKSIRKLYAAGVPLLAKSLNEFSTASTESSKVVLGPIYKYPNNHLVMTFLWNLAKSILKHFLYGAFIEKVWAVGRLSCNFIELEKDFTIENFDVLPNIGSGITAADPVGATDSGIYLEQIGKWNKGRIALWDYEKYVDVELPRIGHYSFPTVVPFKGRNFIFPESAQHSSPRLFEIDESGLWIGTVIVLEGLERTRLKDPVLFSQNDEFFIFGGESDSEQRLNLYISNNLFGPYKEHPSSPILLSPMGARMAGPIYSSNQELFRFGQNCSAGYGRGVTVFKILEISDGSYREARVGQLLVQGALGPHSLLFINQSTFFDYYVEKIHLLAGFKRAISLLLRMHHRRKFAAD